MSSCENETVVNKEFECNFTIGYSRNFRLVIEFEKLHNYQFENINDKSILFYYNQFFL